MVDRIPSDHPSIETVRAEVERHGGGLRLTLPGDILPTDEPMVRLVVEERTLFARLDRTSRERDRITGLYGSARGAKATGDAVDRLDDWLAEGDRGPGTSVEIDVIEPGYRYGLRLPGDRTVYHAAGRPDSDLADIARNLEDH